MDIIIRSIAQILFFLFFISTQNSMLSLGMNITCNHSERTALLSFKQHLKDPFNSLSSWSGENCCRWAGVICNNRTDHVVQLQLQNLGLGGELNPSLQELKQLRHLDLSFNKFEGISIPDFLGSLQSLSYLNLSRAGFGGMIPHQLGNLSNLRYLDLSYSNHENELTVIGNFQWLSRLSSLKHLELSDAYLYSAANWFYTVNMLPCLIVLRLSNCYLPGVLPSLSYVNFTSLEVLDLSHNYLNLALPKWLYSFTSIEQLDLSFNSFRGTISPSIGNLTKLTLLDLSYNHELEGEIPTAFGNLCKLQKLDLSTNKLSGPLPHQLGKLQNLDFLSLMNNSFSESIPFSIGRLTLLTHLDLSKNELNGTIPESFGNLSKLEVLRLSNNLALEGILSEVLFSNLTSLRIIELDSLELRVSPEWKPPFQLQIARFRNCRSGPWFPNWIQTQKFLIQLDMSSNEISGTVPTWFWNLSSQFSYLNLSHNNFNGELPRELKFDSNSVGIFLSSNQFKGPLPRLASTVVVLDLSNNSISGPISTLLCNPLYEINDLGVLDLSINLLSGDLSQCWFYWRSLKLLRLENNKITGKIPSSIGSLYRLLSLHLQKNNLSDELPLALRNCTLLKILDIGENVLTGTLPIWLGESLPDLIFLRLRLNKFHGEIPQNLCHMTSLQILDLAHNNLSGSIPRCFSNFTAMVTKQISNWPIDYLIFGDYRETSSLVTKGREVEYYSKILILVTNMDLSKNYLSGEIPEELTSLIQLQSLNLSDNRFIGKIPEKIGNMSSLESLDFSKNRISGVIPQSISSLFFLSYLNLSYNSLSGKIPSSTQLQSFNMSSYIGNEELCGLPLIKYCNGEEPSDRVDEDWFEMTWFYIGMGVGFVLGFLVFWGVLVLKKSWRFAYFEFVGDMKDKLCTLF